MLKKILLLSLCTAISSSIFAAEETIFYCDAKPNGSIKVTKNQTLYNVNILKNGKNILDFSKDYKRNTKNNFIKFNYSGGSELVSIGIVMGYLGKDKNSLHSISSDEYTTFNVVYDIDNVNILECLNNQKYINKFRGIDKKRSLPAFYYD
jgi:hypothetical protein